MKYGLLIVYLINICLAGCGQKGPLILPDSEIKEINSKDSLHKYK